MATVSRQSAFWAVVALGLNTFVQPGGRVLDFPAEYSRALRLSPVVCAFDTLGVFISLIFFSRKTRSIKDGVALAARYRGLTEDDPAEPKLERTWWFRFSVFALGALPQAVKVLGMDGIPLTRLWGMAYLVSFLILEGLDLLRSRQHIDYHALDMDVEEVLDNYLTLIGVLTVCTQALCFILQLFFIAKNLGSKCDMEHGSSPQRPQLTNALIVIGGMMACFAITVLLMAHRFVSKDIPRRFVEWCQIHYWLVAVLIYLGIILASIPIEPTCSFRVVSVQMVAINLVLTSAALPFALDEKTFEHRWFRGSFGLIRWFRKLFGLKRSNKEEVNISVLFAIPIIASIICYYMCNYDPSNTYKPPWTEYLG